MPSNRHQTAAVVSITLVGLGARFHYLTRLDVPTDEAITLWFITNLTPLEILTIVPVVQPHFPTYYLFLKGWAAVGSTAPLWLRIPSVLAGTATIPVVYLLARRLGNWQAGLVAAVMVAVSPFAIEQSQLIRMYALLALMVVASWWRLLVYLDTRSRRNLVHYALTAAGLVSLHYFGGLYLAAQLLYLTLIGARDRWPRQVLHAGSAATAVSTPAGVWIFYRLVSSPGAGVESVMGLQTPIAWDGLRFIIQFVLGADIAWLLSNEYYWIVGPTLALGLLGITAAVGYDWQVSNRSALLVFWIAGPLIVLYAYSHLRTPVFRPRYLIGAAYGLYTGAGIATIAIPNRLLRATVAILVVTSMAAAATVSYDTNAFGASEAFGDIESSTPSTERMVVIGLFSKAWQYHAQGADVQVVAANTTVKKASVSPSAAGGRVFVLHRKRGAWGPQDFTTRDVGLECYRVAGVWAYAEVTVYDLRAQDC